jgi:hypothetical protein
MAVDTPIATLEKGRSVLEHHGVKGMHWGVRRGDSAGGGSTEVTVRAKPGRHVKTSGGKRQGAHEDAIKTAISKQKARKSTTDALSTKELQDLVTRLNLEQQYSRLVTQDSASRSDVGKILDKTMAVGKTVNDVNKFLNTPAGKVVKTTLTTALKAKLKK